MCGIIGYVGYREAAPILIDGLKKLEYRGYDSSGVGVISSESGEIVVRKAPGKIRNLEEFIDSQRLPSAQVGISHTRWATHGAPSRVNAHPHGDNSRRILVVHNGIIENYQELKSELQKHGAEFVSETDTEVIAHLISRHYHGDFFAAVKNAIRQLKGAFAIGVLCKDEPGTVIAARVGSPLILGLGKNENFIASDVPAILDYTRRVIYLKDGEMAVIKKNKIELFTFAGKKVKAQPTTVTFSVDAVQKQGFAHFMLKEIHEQPDVIAQMLKTRVRNNHIRLDGMGLSDKQLKGIRKIFVVACGTAYHAGMVGKYVIEKLAGIPVSIDVSSEFRYRDPIVDKKTLVVAISQSGETADTLAAVKEARAKGAKVVSVCNVVGSSLARESDGILYTHAGPEVGVASTKAYTAQVCMLCLMALKLGAITKSVPDKERRRILDQLKKIPALYRIILKDKHEVARIGKENHHFGCFLFLGRNVNFPSALEGALKLKEISYVPAEGYAAGEMKHGPIALIDEYRAVVCIAPQSAVYEKMISNIQEIRARKGKIIAIATRGDKIIRQHANHVIDVPPTDEILTPLLAALPLQLIAYYIAVERSCDVDQPRNLAKSVTVE
ncbi:MAG: glutamine--fructose-6-phosphate transaminase (isomerizing) [Candidatus Omnitrophota bacterium]|nr:glutamine--fructose-6-phosphate transaminase (isomerizing) [Candidatus Omnitrophota bacterium]MDZ4242046.1 glutamine--fructose-6-phosphate transaminase (isomerizing) [Candidatus Omnitrophota bacterium]